ncbi:GntR family transcriptional regulator [Arenibacter algicola]|uniref:GntR family transcriptional regulator n=1 Tax=Arenibacter algicola TaxID=616991 RepID=UPI001C072843|nr:GntR family transcriptional regulator [Arenibacter algicola]MBU2904083.1 GntR family transcriptional regulator [Arenibacter algicola]
MELGMEEPKIEVNLESKQPIYKQIVNSIQQHIETGELKEGDYIPSLNDLSADLGISKETVKKAYSILRKNAFIESSQGKGYFVSMNRNSKIRILLLFDKLSTYKQVIFNAFVTGLEDSSEITIRLHNQDIDVFESFIENGLDKYDHYVITSHFPLIPKIQARALLALGKIPNRKLLILDHNVKDLPGNFCAVYQDPEKDVYNGLLQGLHRLREFDKLNIMSSPGSLYSKFLIKGIDKFCVEHNINYEIHYIIKKEKIKKREVYLILNGQLDIELINLIKVAKLKNYIIGTDIGIISYNESPINEIILNGLTVLSTDFEQMGRIAAKMILKKTIKKVQCKFNLIRRSTF